jgi:proline dehydrogenase
MSSSQERLVARIAERQGLSVEQVAARVASRQARCRGLLGPRAAAHTLQWSHALAAAEQRLTGFLAAGSRHVSGLRLDDALAAARFEAGRGHRATLGYWPPPVQAPGEVSRQVIEAIEALGAARLDASVSIKVDLMDYRRDLLDGVIAAAAAHRVRVHFDAQGLETVDRTHALIESSLGRGAEVSATLPARWRRSAADAERFIAWGLPLRVVKGQGGDPAWPQAEPRRGLLELVDRLAGRAAQVGVATHDRRSAEPALQRLQAAGTPCSLEQLRSLPRLDGLAAQLGVPVRVYVAYGRFGLPYAVREVLRRPAIVGWILRDLLVRHRPALAASTPPEGPL